MCSRGFFCHPGGGVEGDVNHVVCAVFVKVSDPVVSAGDLDVVVSIVFPCDSGSFGVNHVGVVDVDVIVVPVPVVDVVVMVVGGRQYQCGVVDAV